MLEQIKKLLKLGESSNANEAAAAIAKAHALMFKHGIESSMLHENNGTDEDEEVVEFFDPLFKPSGRQIPAWVVRLASMLGRSRGCQVYRSRWRDLSVLGRREDVAALRFLFEFCRREIEILARRNAFGEGRTYVNNYRIGCVDAIAAAITAEQRAALAQIRAGATSERALVAIDNAVVKIKNRHTAAAEFGRKKLGLRPRSGHRINADAKARAAGLRDGASIYGRASGAKNRLT